MKKSRWLVLGMLGLVLAVGLNGCIISASPDNQYPITMESGDKIDFAVTCSGGPNISYGWNVNGQWLKNDLLFFQGTSNYTFSDTTPGKYTITCRVDEWVVLPEISSGQSNPGKYIHLWSGQRTWEVEVVAAD